MLKITINDDMTKIEGAGSLIDTAKDLGVIVLTLYNQIRRASPDAARIFKTAVVALMCDAGPVWTQVSTKDCKSEKQVFDMTELCRQIREDGT